MIVKNVEKKEDNTVSFQVSCDAAEFAKAVNDAYLKAKKNIYKSMGKHREELR